MKIFQKRRRFARNLSVNKDEGELTLNRKVLTGLFISAICCFMWSQGEGVTDAKEVLTEKAEYRDYLINIYRDEESAQRKVVVRRKGKIAYEMKGENGGLFRIGDINGDKKYNASIPVGKDITGRGIPDLVVSEWTGGAHCCFNYYVFELGERFQQIAKLEVRDADLSHFEDLDNDGKLEFVTNDFTFAYWNSSFAESPAPEVILSFREGTYKLVVRLMSKPVPEGNVLKEKAKQVREDRSWKEGNPPVELWKTMLDLIYTGNADAAWKLLDKSWPKNIPGKKKFIADFKAQLKTSPYYVGIMEMNSMSSAREKR